MSEKVQTLPTLSVTGYWDEGSVSDVPEQIKVVMSDGRRAMYHINVEQPKPNVLRPSEMVRIMENHIFGGVKK